MLKVENRQQSHNAAFPCGFVVALCFPQTGWKPEFIQLVHYGDMKADSNGACWPFFFISKIYFHPNCSHCPSTYTS